MAIAVASGAVLAALPTSAYAGVGSSGQIIAVSGTSGGITEVTPSGTTVRTLTGSGTQPAWAPSGARVVSIVGDSVVSQRYDGTDLHTVHTTGASTGAPSGPTYAFDGQDIVYTAGNKLQVIPADASTPPANLLNNDPDSGATNPTGGNCDTQASSSQGSGYLWFTRSGGGCGNDPTVYRYNESAGDIEPMFPGGSGAVQAPANGQVVYTGADGEAYLGNLDGSNPAALTSDGRHYGSFSWSPDGQTIWAVATSGSTRSQVKIDIAGATPTVSTVTGTGAYTAWQPQNTVDVGRVYGSSAAATNIAASHWVWSPVGKPQPGLPTAGSAVLVASGDSVDASLAPALAARKNGPALMTSAGSLDSAVQTELKRTVATGDTVYLIGGTSVLSSAVSTKVASLGYKVVRLSGSSRYVTSVDVAKATASAPDYVFLATGADYHSIMEAEAAAGSGGPGSNATAVYTDGSTMTSSVYDYLNSLSDNTLVISVGSATTALTSAWKSGHLVNDLSYLPISGTGNAGTSVALAKIWWAGLPYTATFVDGNNWHDGLDGFSSMASWGPVMWVTPTAADAADETYLKDESSQIQNLVTFSGTSNVTTNALNGLANSLAVSGDFKYDTFPNGYTSIPTKPAKAAVTPFAVRNTTADPALRRGTAHAVHNLSAARRLG